MPLYDFACPACGARFEDMAASDETARPCPDCGSPAKRTLSVGRSYRADAPWIESVTAVAEKDSGKPHVEAFLAAPSRATYRDWMHGEGIRPQEPGENRRPTPDAAPLRQAVLERFHARRGLV
mgnify:CR=1 FL=1